MIMRLVLLVVAAGVTVHLLTLRTKIQSPS
jgi:hypothetical protein